jgi:TRAP transporter TAXI family solute receptor
MGKSLDDYQSAGKLIQIQPSQIGEMMRDGRVDVYFECTTLNHPSVTEIALTNDLVFLPLPDKVIQDMKAIGMTPIVMKAGGYRGLDADYPSSATGNNIIAFKDAPEEAVYQLTRAIIERRAEFVEDNPQLRTWDPVNDRGTGTTVPLHPGAERYYREIGWIK